jgi:hypothetical protein
MGAQTVPKPQSLRLPRDLDAQVRVFAQTLSRKEPGGRIPMNKALLTLVEAGLKSLQADPSPKAAMLMALHELDPEWSGGRLGDFEPVTVATRSGRSPVQVLLDRRG